VSRRLLSQDDLERIYKAAVHILADMGMKVDSPRCLDAMAAFGATVDPAQQRAIMSPEVIDRMLEIAREDCAGWERRTPRLAPEYSIGGSGTCPFIFDDEIADRRPTREADCIEAFRILETSPATSCETPVYPCDVPPQMQSIRALELGMRTLNQTTLTGIDLFFASQVPFVAEMGRLYCDDPAWFLPAGNCPNSPLHVSNTIAELALQLYAVPTMPVMGANAPMTPAGTAVIGVAEILGGYVLAKPKFPWVWYSVLGFVGLGAASALSFGAKSMSLCSHVLRNL